MTTLLAQLWTILVAFGVLLVPGTPWLVLLGLNISLPPYLRAPAAAVLTLFWTGVLLIPALTIGLDIHWMLVGMILVTLAGAALCRARHVDLSLPLGLWRRFHPLIWLQLALIAVMTLIVGGSMTEGDPLYHAAYARKLLDLHHPHFANTQLFVDGSFHPGYLVPAWHETIALTSLISRADITTAMWSMPVVVSVLALLAIAGLAGVVLRSERGAVLGAAAFLFSDVIAGAPHFDLLGNAMSPSAIAEEVVVTVGIAAWIIALHGRGAPGRRSAYVLVLACAPALTFTHPSYLVWYGLAIVGYLLAWAVGSRGAQRLVRRHAWASIGLLVFAGVCFGALLPALHSLNSFAGQGGHSQLATDYGNFRQLLVGNVHHFHLRPDLLVAAGVFALIGLVCAGAAVLIRDEPGIWYVTGTTGFVSAIALSSRVFPHFAKIVSLSQAKRLAAAEPHELGLAIGLLALAALVSHLRRLRWGTAVAVALTAVLSLVIAAFVHHERAPATLKSGKVVPGWPVTLVMLALVLTFVVVIVRRAVRWAREHEHPAGAEAPARGPLLPITRAGALAAVAVLVVGSAPTELASARALRTHLRNRPSSSSQVDTLATVDSGLVHALRKLPVGTVVMAPQTFDIRLAALAPIYITSAPLAQVAVTAKNRGADRRSKIEAFYAQAATDSARASVVDSEHVQYVVVASDSTQPVWIYLANSPKRYVEVEHGLRETMFRVNGPNRA